MDLVRTVQSRRSGLALAFGLGLICATGQAPLGWAWLSLAAFALAIALLTLPERWQVVAWRGWALGTGYFAGSLFWIVEPFLVDLPRHGWMAPFALVLMAGGLALFWAAAFGLAVRFGRTRGLRIGWLVLLLTSAEILRSFLFTGFPWVLIGHVWIGAPQMQFAALFGAHGLTLFTLIAAAMPALFGARRAVLGMIAGTALASLPAGYAHFRVPPGDAANAEPAQVVRLVQPNAPQHEKWDPDLVPLFYQRHLDLTAAEAAPGLQRPDVIIWPETSIPWLLEYAEPAFVEMAQAGQGAQLLVGLQRRSAEGAWFNTLAVLAPDGTLLDSYDKHHLVPFGEYMPLMHVFARWGVFGLAANETGGYTAGPGPALLELGPAGRALPLICYEAIFPNDIARAPGRADWLVQITNDAWFGQVSGPWQHLALARLRAVEQGVPMLRAANTGISAAIDPYGRVIAALPMGQAGKLDVALPAPLAPTFYARRGDLPVFLFLATLFLSLAALSRKSHFG
ncbi:apolipoprotein N-acyltransferase [Aliiruegeria sabulilitoris]|uniref:apolipoprotein N-acyltransferase n=1 Tax=Aliiruegeria sabulilitoris TaxID=1510458 RepID=UPI0008345841|nr:apolipoprotein N-acyltransferase [Aliiruegeria sabulilitoris]NDR59506.1 apolipoprotein N-acyltransferase [Pseudoruegeria sp. M32A2M]